MSPHLGLALAGFHLRSTVLQFLPALAGFALVQAVRFAARFARENDLYERARLAMAAWLERRSDPVRQYAQLTHHFFARFFDNDLATTDSEVRLAPPQALALLAAPAMLACVGLVGKYANILYLPPAARRAAAWGDQCFFVCVSMVVMAFVTIIEWDSLFPARLDYQVLLPLPLQLRTLFLAKISALYAFLGIVTVTINLTPVLLYPLLLLWERGMTLGYVDGMALLLRTMLAVSTGVNAAGVFVFLSCVALQGLAMNLLPHRALKRASAYLQCLLLFAALSVLFLYPMVSARLGGMLQGDTLLYYAFPPVWFFGLNQVIQGSREPIFLSLAGIAWRALAIATAVVVATYIASYRRHARATLEAMGSDTLRPGLLRRAFVALASRTFLAHPLERAAFFFTTTTVARSGKHRLIVAGALGIGMAFVLENLATELGRPGRAGAARLEVALLAIPLILSFFLLIGLRVVFLLPAELRANWAFRITETHDCGRCLGGVRKAVIASVVVPLLASLAPFYLLLWGGPPAFLHLLFSLVLSLLVVELLFGRFTRIPFTCSYLAGNRNLTALIVGYAFAFLAYLHSMPVAEQWLLAHPAALVIFLAVSAAALRGMRWVREHAARRGALVFEEKPDPAVLELHLSTNS